MHGSQCHHDHTTTHHHLKPLSEHLGVSPQLGDLISASRCAVGAAQYVDDSRCLRRGGDLQSIGDEDNTKRVQMTRMGQERWEGNCADRCAKSVLKSGVWMDEGGGEHRHSTSIEYAWRGAFEMVDDRHA